MKYIDRVINIIPIKSSAKPVFNMSFTLIRFVPKTIVLAPVATGSINPKDAAKVAGTINNKG